MHERCSRGCYFFDVLSTGVINLRLKCFLVISVLLTNQYNIVLKLTLYLFNYATFYWLKNNGAIFVLQLLSKIPIDDGRHFSIPKRIFSLIARTF